ncbi:hypothetical protein ACFL9U_07545 [Thermodesulfobacteriota bacterium]
MNRVAVKTVLFGLIFLLINCSDAIADSAFLREGIEQYKQENFEEAVDVLIKAREVEPTSSTAAFFLGLTYKRMMEYSKAAEHMRDAVSLQPRIKEALVELVDILYRLGAEENLKEAKSWIVVAEKEEIFPAKIAFLKGLILQKEGKNMQAIQSFERAQELDPGYRQTAEFQIALSYLKEKELQKAKERFRAAIVEDPSTDLAGFARRYEDLVEKRLELEKPWRITMGVFGGYDSNVVLAPLDTSVVAPGITDEGSAVLAASLRVDYVPLLEGPWLFNASYSFFGNWHENYSTSHDTIVNSLYLAPGYNFGKFALNIAGNYSNVMLKSPSYNNYLNQFFLGPMLRVLLNPNHMLEFLTSYAGKEYADPPLAEEEDRDEKGFMGYASWVWSFRNGGLLNLKYQYTKENADGVNWDNQGDRFVLNARIPIIEKVKLQLTGDLFLQNFDNVHTTFGVKRKDDVHRGSVGLTWEFLKNTHLILQYSKTRSNSNIEIYEYDRELYNAGIEYRF